MNAFNRVVMILLVLLALFGAVLVLLITFGAVAPAQLLPGAYAETGVGMWLASFTRMPPTETLITTVVALALIIVGLLLLIAELRPERRTRTITVREDGLGIVTVRAESVRDLIAYTTAGMPEVLQVQPEVDSTKSGLKIRCRAALSPEANIPQVSAELQSRIQQAVEQHLGMKVANVAVMAQLEPLAGVGRRPTRAQPRRQLR